MQKKLPASLLALSVGMLALSTSALANLTSLEDALKKKNYPLAYGEGEKLLATQAGEPKFDLLFGMAAARAGELDQAIFAFERVLITNPNSQIARYELGRAYFALGNNTTARHHFNKLRQATPKPPANIMQGIQLHLASMEAQEAGRSVATKSSQANFYVGANLGYDDNPKSLTYKDEVLPGLLKEDLTGFKIESSLTQETYLGGSYFKQFSSGSAWFLAGEVGQKSFFESSAKNANNQNLSLQTGWVFLGSDWRLTLPLQGQYLTRKDDVKVNVLGLGLNLTNQLTDQLTTDSNLQVSQVNYQPSSYKQYSTNNFNLGWQFTYRPINPVRLSLGALAGLETAQKSSHKHNGRNFYGAKANAGWAVNNQLRFDLNASYLTATHLKKETLGGESKKREDDQLSLGLRVTQRFNHGWQVHLNMQNNDTDSNYNLYTYKRAVYSLGVRKEW